jgi:hypothetical protein
MRFFLALGVFALWLLIILMAPRAIPISRGEMVFGAIGILAFMFCLLAGVFLTADCLSEEKREGSLGLLFLTDLDGYDVVIGKLIGTSVNALYGLLAIFPLLAYSLLLGGVTLGEFWRVTLALFVTMILSLSVGMFVSARSSGARESMWVTLLVLGLLALWWPALVLLLGMLLKSSIGNFLMWPSPACVFGYAFDSIYNSSGGIAHYIGSLLGVLLVSGVAMSLASRHVALAWREKAEETQERELDNRSRLARFGAAAFRSARMVLLDGNPFHWLASRDRLPRLVAWRILGAQFFVWLLFMFGCVVASGTNQALCFNGALVMSYGLHHALKWFVAIESSRRLSDDRHSGALELLLVTPVQIEQIIAGQRRALVDMFRGPMLLALLTNFALFVILMTVNPGGLSGQESFICGEILIGGGIMLLIDFHALSWVGMWLALQTKRHNRAILATLGRVMLTPWLAVFSLVLLTIGGRSLSLDAALTMSPVWFALAAVIEYVFAARAKIGLVEALRQISAGADPYIFKPKPPEESAPTYLEVQTQ